MQRPARVLAVATLAVLAISCGDNDTIIVPVSKVVTFKATMNAAAEVQTPPVTSPNGTGVFTATLDTSTNVFTYDITFSGLTSNVTLGHIHGPATTTQSVGVILNFATLPGATFTLSATSGTAHGSTILNAANQLTATVNGDSLRKLLFAGLTYANIHTTNFPAGEIRGQIIKQ
jgi:hypothetical protein